MSSLHFELLDWPAARAGASPVRREVFIMEQGVPADLEWDEWDAVSLHCLAVDETHVVRGTGRLLPDDDQGVARIGRMAVMREWRHRGVGAGILEALLHAASQRKTRRIELHAQVQATAFYARYGFREEGDIFDEAGIPHLTMVRLLDPLK
jgi:predicted GNAT family N-acyltransferase